MEKLYPHQRTIIDEAIEKTKKNNFRGACLSLPMGYGKTLISLNLGCELYSFFLIICSKTLISNWVNEIEKFYDSKLKYEVLHSDYIRKNMNEWVPKSTTKVIITTPETIAKSYTNSVRDKFITINRRTFDYFNVYNYPTSPFGNTKKGCKFLHSIKWKGIFIDECQNYTNIECKKSQAIASLCGNHRWLLSGTVFQEPKLHRILGFFLLLGLKEPRNINDCKDMIKSYNFKGINQYCIIRKDNPKFKNIKLNTHIIKYEMPKQEAICFSMLKDIITKIYEKYKEEMARNHHDEELIKSLKGTLLAMLTYLRQALIIPQIPISKLVMNMTLNHDDDDLIANTLLPVCNNFGISKWLDSEESKISTRIMKCIEILYQHENDKTVVFCSFSSCLKYLKYIYDEFGAKNTFILSSDTNIMERSKTLKAFEECKSGVLFMTYMLGSEGLNLQCANTIIHLDLYWNKGKENQALARIYRAGQISPNVNQYIIVSNTQLEKIILERQKEKLTILNELQTGRVTSLKISNIKMCEIVKILNNDKVYDLANVLKDYCI